MTALIHPCIIRTITWGVFSLGAKPCEVPDDFDIENATSDELAAIVGDDALNPDYLGEDRLTILP